jgi:hypothetical protein
MSRNLPPEFNWLDQVNQNIKKRKSPNQETDEERHKDKKPPKFVGQSSKFKHELAERGATVTHKDSDPKAVAQLRTPGKPKDVVRPTAVAGSSGRKLFDDKKPPAPVEEEKPPVPRPKTPPVPTGEEVYKAFDEGSPKRTIPKGAQSVAPVSRISRQISFEENEDGSINIIIGGYSIRDEAAFRSEGEDIFDFFDSIVAGEEQTALENKIRLEKERLLRLEEERGARNFDDFIEQQQEKLAERALEEAIEQFGLDTTEPLPTNKKQLRGPASLRF